MAGTRQIIEYVLANSYATAKTMPMAVSKIDVLNLSTYTHN